MNIKLIDIIHQYNLRNDTNYDFGTDKEYGHKYISNFYEKEFEKYQDKPISLLEIGTHKGGSLALWHYYFKNAQTIVGMDVAEFGAQMNCLRFNNVKIIYQDAYLEPVASFLPNYDIIIDDGPHTKESHLQSLKLYLPKLNKGGVFIVEDIAQMEWTEEYKSLVPPWMTYEIFDIREPSGISDSIIFCVRH